MWQAATGEDADSDATKLAIFTLIGQVVYFRIGREAVQRRMDDLQASGATSGGDTWLVYQPKPGKPTTPRQGSAGGMIILRLLKFARVHQPGVTRAESIREWLALQVYAETGSLEEVARRLGMSSLDGAAHVVGHNWLTTDAHDRQPPAHRGTHDVGTQS